jgi:hypothetical protein
MNYLAIKTANAFHSCRLFECKDVKIALPLEADEPFVQDR